MELELFFKIIFKKVYIQICDEVFSVKKYLPKLEPIWWIYSFRHSLTIEEFKHWRKKWFAQFCSLQIFLSTS